MGRKPKPKLTITEQEDAVLAKILIGQNLTLDETALALWMIEGRKTPKPFSKVYIEKIERSALSKLRKGLARAGIHQLSDVFSDARYRTNAKYDTAADSID